VKTVQDTNESVIEIFSAKKEAAKAGGFRAWFVIVVVGGRGLEPLTPCV